MTQREIIVKIVTVPLEGYEPQLWVEAYKGWFPVSGAKITSTPARARTEAIRCLSSTDIVKFY